jgi:hypothetical protein
MCPFASGSFISDTFGSDTFVSDPFVSDPFVSDTFVSDPFVSDPFVFLWRKSQKPKKCSRQHQDTSTTHTLQHTGA